MKEIKKKKIFNINFKILFFYKEWKYTNKNNENLNIILLKTKKIVFILYEKSKIKQIINNYLSFYFKKNKNNIDK